MRSLRHPVFGRLFLAQVVSLLGTGLTTIALGLLAYDMAGPRAGTILGTAFTLKMVAYVVVAPLATALFAGMPPKRILVGSEVVRVAAAACLPLVDQVWQVLALVFILQAASATFIPVMNAVVPEVLPNEQEYTQALSLTRLATDLEAVASPALAALLLTLVDVHTLFLGTAAGFAASAAVIALCLLPRTLPHDDEPGPLSHRALQGITLFLRHRQLRPVVLVHLCVAAVMAFVLVQTVVVVRGVLDLPEAAVGWALAINGAGSMLTALLIPRLLRGLSTQTVMTIGCLVLAAGGLLIPPLLGRGSSPAAIAALALLWLALGIGWAMAEVPIGLVITRSTRAQDRPGAFAAQFSLEHACWLVTYPLAGWLGSRALVSSAWTMAGITCLAAVVAIAMLRAAVPEDGAGLVGSAEATTANV